MTAASRRLTSAATLRLLSRLLTGLAFSAGLCAVSNIAFDLATGMIAVGALGARAASPNLAQGPTPTAAAPGGAVAPSFDDNQYFVKPIRPPSPVIFNVTVDPHKVAAGSIADIVVTFELNDKPLPGAAVQLAMLFTPGNDYSFTPDNGVTDANGVFNARVRVSKNAGDSIIAATSGVFSDQDHVTGTGERASVASAPTATNPAQGAGSAPLVLLGVAAAAVVAAGFYLKMRSMGA